VKAASWLGSKVETATMYLHSITLEVQVQVRVRVQWEASLSGQHTPPEPAMRLHWVLRKPGHPGGPLQSWMAEACATS